MKDMLTKFVAQLDAEIASLTAQRDAEKRRIADMIAGTYGESHLGHNVTAAAGEITKLTGKLEQTQKIAADLKARIELSEGL